MKKNKTIAQLKRDRRKGIVSAIFFAATYALVLFVLLQSVSPRRYDVQAGDVAAETITATKEIVDQVTTQQLKNEAAQSVEPIYYSASAEPTAIITGQVTKNVTDALDVLSSVQDQGQQYKDAWRTQNPTLPESQFMYSQAQVEAMKYLFSFSVSNEEVLALFALTPEDISQLRTSLLQQVSVVLNNGIHENDLASNKSTILTNLSGEATLYPAVLLQMAGRILDRCLIANIKVDDVATEAARQQASDSVAPVKYKKGQNVVLQGETITAAQVEVLKDLGLLSNNAVDVGMYAGLSLLVGLLFGLCALYAAVFLRELLFQPRKVLMYCILFTLGVLVSSVLRDLQSALIPLSFATILIAVLLHTRLALVTNISLSVILAMLVQDSAGLFGPSAVSAMITSLVSGTVAVYLCRRTMHRSWILLTGLLTGLAGMAAYVAINMILSDSLLSTLLTSLWVLGGGLGSAVIVIGTLPIWEMLFDVLTPTKLLEITNPNQPLLRRLSLEAPGTHHHSIVVANLAETAAARIGANPLLVRAAAYYHDIGKLSAPECYGENQQRENFHALLTPQESVAIIRSHPADGAEMARKAKLPRAIVDSIEQHHGSMPIYVFYSEALEHDKNVHIEDYSYPGPLPQSKEAALIMLADSTEAAVRSMSDKSPGAVREKIDEMILDRVTRRQFARCPITLRELDVVAEEFTQTLSAVHHERLAYPNLQTIEHEEELQRKGESGGMPVKK